MLSWLFVKSKFWFAIRIADKNTRDFVMHWWDREIADHRIERRL